MKIQSHFWTILSQTDTEIHEEETENCFDGSRILLYHLFEKEVKLKSASVTTESSNGSVNNFEIPIGQDCYLKDTGKFLHQMAARKQIQNLQEIDLKCPCSNQPCNDPTCLLERKLSCEEAVRALGMKHA